MTFPQDWPNGCPATDVPGADGIVYRIVKVSPPTATDMLSHHESGRLPTANPCLRCGLSVFGILEDARNQRQLMPKLGGWIARGTLTPTHGKAHRTPGQQPSHTTWWPYEGVDRAAIFSVIPEVV